MSDEIDYKKLYEQEKRKVDDLEKDVLAFKTDPVKRGYFALSRILNLQIDALNEFQLKANIGGKKSEDATFERMQGIWSNLSGMLTSLNDLKITLKVTSDDEKQYSQKTYSRITTPESMADNIGELAGRKQ